MLRHSIISIQAFLLLFSGILTTSSCLKDPENNNTNNNEPARARIEITDAPIDDPNVKGVFVTVADILVDGKSWVGFDGKTTFDLFAYQNGETKLLGEGELKAGTYDEIVLVFDTETDANGNSPGCYVKNAQDEKKKLDGGSDFQVKASGNFDTKTNETAEALIDMTLRNAIVYQSGSDTEFEFVTNPELNAAVRLMDKTNTGNISGNCTDGVSGSDKVIVYAYKKGEYNVNEKFPQGASDIQFKNAVTSSVVANNGDFTLAFLESGSYELHFISYQADSAGKLQVKGELQLNILNAASLNLLSLNVSAKAEINLDLVVTGILFF